MRKINVLSLFDGLGGARIALDRLGIECNYYASEVDKYAIKIAMKNYPDIIQLGDVKGVRAEDLPDIDLLIGGSPCQDLSVAKSARKGLKGPKSGLFYEFARLLKETNPKTFILENVASMSLKDSLAISRTLKASPVKINSGLVTSQNRNRLYWTPSRYLITQPLDRKIYLKDIIVDGYVDRDRSHCLDANYHKGSNKGQLYFESSRRQIVFKDKKTFKEIQRRIKNGESFIYTIPRGYNKGGFKLDNRKAPTVTSSYYEQNNLLYNQHGFRKLLPLECARLQGVPDNYAEGISATQQYKMICNGFTVPVIEHILSFAMSDLKCEEKK